MKVAHYFQAIAVASLVLAPMVLSAGNPKESIHRTIAITVADGAQVYLTGGPSADYSGYYMTASSSSDVLVASSATPTLNSVWKLLRVTDLTADEESLAEDSQSVYLLYNSLTSRYVGQTSTESQSASVSLVSDVADAGRYCVVQRAYTDGENYLSLVDIDNPTANYAALNISSKLVNYALYNGSALRPNSLFSVGDTTDDIAVAAQTLLTSYEDNYYIASTAQFDYIGDLYETDESHAAYTQLQQELSAGAVSVDSYVALNNIITVDMAEPMSSARRVQFKEGHYYHIESPYYGYTDRAVAETYYVKDYNPLQKRQRVHFTEFDNYAHVPVPTFWKFVPQEVKDGTDAEAYFKIIAANSGLAMRVTGYNTIVDTRPVDDSEVGVYSYQKESNLIKHDHSVTLLGHNDNDARSKTYHLATFYDSSYEDYDIRDGDSPLDVDDAVVDEGKISGANNWRVHELTECDLSFPVGDDNQENSYRSICLPFAVKVPDGATAYSLLDAKSVWGSTAFELAKITFTDGTKDIIPANTPAILLGPSDQTLSFQILYDDTHSPIYFSLEGAITPVPIEDGKTVFVVDDATDETGHTSTFTKKVGGTDYSYDKDDMYKDAGRAAESLISSTATYIIDANHACVDAESVSEPDEKVAAEGGRVTTSNIDITVSQSGSGSTADTTAFYDLSGRRVTRPAHGVFVSQDGVKFLFP